MPKPIEEFPNSGKIDVDLTGPDGNAFAVLGLAQRLAKQLGLDNDAIQKDMTSGDYEHLIEVFEKHFSDHVNLYR